VKKLLCSLVAFGALALPVAFIAPASAATTCTTTADNGTCGPYVTGDSSSNNTDGSVIQDVWNDVNIHQSLSATSASNWTATATATGTAVQSYPDSWQILVTGQDTSPEVSSYSYLNSDFQGWIHEQKTTDAEMAYDIWLGNAAKGNYNWELMIWELNDNQDPEGGGGHPMGTLDVAGVKYTVYASTKNQNQDTYIDVVRNVGQTTGSADLATFVEDLQAQGFYPSDIGFSAVGFGFEVCQATNEAFQVTQYNLNAACKAGKDCDAG
jgi:hypothetical protein